jgi:glycosyltransferase involved in cell wall biosynthesis
MRILIISTFFPPRNSIASLRPYSFAKYFSRMGHDVTVLTQKKESNPLTDLKYPFEGFTCIEIEEYQQVIAIKKEANQKKCAFYWKYVDAFRKKRGIFHSMRMPDLTQLWVKPALYRIQQEAAFDVILSTSGPFTTHEVAFQLKKRGYAKKWIADFRDPWSDNEIFKGLFPFNYIEKFYEKYLLEKADVISSVSHKLSEKMAQKYPHTKCVTVENGYDREDYRDLETKEKIFQDDTWRLFYAGSLYLSHGTRNLPLLFEALAEMKKKSCLDHFELIFAGPDQEPLEKLIATYGLEDYVKHLGFISREQVLQMQNEVQALLFLPWADPSIEGILTGKIFEYLASTTPILSIASEKLECAQKLLLEAKAGTVCFTKEEIMMYLKKRTSLQKQPRDLQVIARYDRELLAKKILASVL